jgi:molybdate transport system substrate-binding protein
MPVRAIPLALALVVALAAAAPVAAVTGGAASGTRAASPRLVVYAASSLTEVFPKIDARARYSFAGSNALALQIRNRAPADVFASASPGFTQDLFRAGLVERPRALAYNRLALVVPKGNPAGITSVFSLRRAGIKLVVAAPEVPVGAYTLEVLRKLGLSSVLARVVSRETDVRGVVAKVALGEADAGFAYVTDARAFAGEVKLIALPARAQPRVRYEIAVVAASRQKTAARAFVARALGPVGRGALARAGFVLP